MPDHADQKTAADPNAVFDDFEWLKDIATRSFARAARRAIAENDALGIPSVGTVGGKPVVRLPPENAANP